MMGPVSGQSTSGNQDDPGRRHSELRDLTSPLLSAGAKLKPCRSEGDEWTIVHEIVGRIDRGSGSFLLPKQRSPIRRRLLKKICESFNTRLEGRISLTSGFATFRLRLVSTADST